MGLQDILQIVYACLPESPFPVLHKVNSSSDPDPGRDDGGEDRISALPDELLRNVVSRLPVKDAARTTAISPRWRSIWRSTPLLLEDCHLLRQVDLRDGIDWSALASAVSRVLASHPGPFRWVHLSWNFMGLREKALAKWLRLFAAKGVESLVLVNRPWPLDVPLPASILRCSSLRRLYLGVWQFPDTSGLLRRPDVFPHLQELGICHTIMEECDLDYLLACSPELNIFALIASYGFPSRVRITSQSLCCMVLWFSMAKELAVVAAPRLQRLILYSAGCPGTERVKLKIGHAPQLTVLGYLETANHVLEIGNTIITTGVTVVRPNAMVPSVKLLALKVNFGAAKEVQTLLSFLRCFPQVETLHVMGDIAEENHDSIATAAEASGELDSKFWQEVGPIECLEAHVKKLVLDQFNLGVGELGFLELVLGRGQMLHKVMLVLGAKNSTEAAATVAKLTSLASMKFAAEECALEILARPRGHAWSYRRASDLSVSDPFPC